MPKPLKEVNEAVTNDLLKEYTQKLFDLRGRAEKLVLSRDQATRMKRSMGLAPKAAETHADDAELLDLWKMLKPPVKRLAQFVSQTIEHGQLDTLSEIEMRLRLAEYEHHYLVLDEMLQKATNGSRPGP